MQLTDRVIKLMGFLQTSIGINVFSCAAKGILPLAPLITSYYNKNRAASSPLCWVKLQMLAAGFVLQAC